VIFDENFTPEIDLHSRWIAPACYCFVRRSKEIPGVKAVDQTIGGDEPAQLFLLYKLIDNSPYHVSVYLTIKKATKAAGIAFNAQYLNLTEKQQRVYLYKPESDKIELVSGYVDNTGGFFPQARVPISVNTTDFRLDLFVYADTYLVQLNGQRLIENRPLFYRNGMLGLYTIGSVVFDNLTLTSADNVDPGDLVYTSDFEQDQGGAFDDADNSTPIEEVTKLLAKLDKEGYDLAVGSRAAQRAEETKKSFLRQLLSNGLRWIAKHILHIGVRDTQCGFKMYTHEAGQVLTRAR
jgi:hypothetical protein